MPGYQATAPARPRGNYRVKVQGKKKTKSHQDLPAIGGKSVMEGLELSNLFSVDVVESVASQPTNNLWFKPLN